MAKKSIYITLFFIVSVVFVISPFSQEESPSAEKLFLRQAYKVDRNAAVDEEVMRTLIGFPCSMEGLDDKSEKLMKSVYNNELIGVKEQILEAYWNNQLTEDNRPDYLQEAIQKNYSLAADVSLEGKMNCRALASKVPEMNVDELMAAFILSSRTGEIADIIPYLYFSNIYIGDEYFAFGHRGYRVSYSQAEMTPDTPLPPEMRLKFWPASDAIIANAAKTIPKLIDVIKNMDVNKTIRLRAATFLNTMDANQLQAIMDQEAIDLRSEIQSILDQDIRWRHSLAMIGYFDRHDPTAYYELKRKQMKLPPDADVRSILKDMDECLWGKY